MRLLNSSSNNSSKQLQRHVGCSAHKTAMCKWKSCTRVPVALGLATVSGFHGIIAWKGMCLLEAPDCPMFAITHRCTGANNDIGASLPVDLPARFGGHDPLQLNSKPRSRLSPRRLWWLTADILVFAPALLLAIAHFYPSMVCLPWTGGWVSCGKSHF